MSGMEAATNVLRARGLRVSGARRHVLAVLFDAPEPLTAEEVAGARDLASVYRNLDVLARHGLVRHVRLGDGPARFYVAAGREYALCESCGALHAAPRDELDPVRLAIADASARFAHVPVLGTCPPCKEAP